MEQILNFMIYKEQGYVKINRLQVIHIYEADYNFLIGAVWREAIQHAQELEKSTKVNMVDVQAETAHQ